MMTPLSRLSAVAIVVLIAAQGCSAAASSSSPASGGSAIPGAHPGQLAFSVGPDEALTYPANLTILPDEHTTFMPVDSGGETYRVFAAIMRNASGLAGPLVLETSDLHTFSFAPGYDSPVMLAAMPFTSCTSSFDPEFDLNYAAPGSVLQDPTRAAGNLIMIYEAENHCPGGVYQHPYYASIGLARSSDDGKTWPAPIDSQLGGPDRYAILRSSKPEPTTAENPPVPMGDAIPSAFIDGNDLYVTYASQGPGSDGMIRMARATLGGNGALAFTKWYNGAFSQPGIAGLDSPVLPSKGCAGYQAMGQISHDDLLRLYFLTFVCASQNARQAGWYFSTATSLDRQDWSSPQMIANSQGPLAPACGAAGTGAAFDGWYPSFVTPGSAAGHLARAGMVFFMNGCDTGKRTFAARTFTIAAP